MTTPPRPPRTSAEGRGRRDEAVFMSDIGLWSDVRKFVRWSANARSDTSEAIAVAKALDERIDAADGEAVDRIEAALSRPDPSLDEAWRAAEAALPEGWTMLLFDYGPPAAFNPGPGKPHHTPRYEASAKLGILSSPAEHGGRSDDSPAAALHALATALGGHDDTPD